MARPSLLIRLAAAALLAAGVCAAIPAGAQESPTLPHQLAQAAADAYEQGQKLFAEGRYERAIAEFDRAVETQPDFHLAHYAAGNALAQLGRTADAAERYEQAVAIRPRFKNGWNALGVAHLSRREYEPALRAFDKALAVDAAFHLARFHRGKALLGLGQHAPAEAAFRKVLAARADDHDTRVALASTLASQGKLDGALEELDRVHAAAPKHAGAYLVRAGVLTAKNALLDAAEAAARALGRGGDDRQMRGEVARVAAQIANRAGKLRDYAAHVRALETLVAIQPQDVATHNGLAGGLIGLYRSKPAGSRDGKLVERALKHLDRSLELDPSQEHIRELRAQLAAEDDDGKEDDGR